MGSNVNQFNATVNAWALKHTSGLSMDIVMRKLVFDGLLGLINYTPVDTGYLRFNWQVSIGSVVTATRGEEGQKVPRMQRDVVGGGAIQGDVPAPGTIPRFGFVYIGNVVAYAQPVNDGTPNRAGEMMVERTQADLTAELTSTVKVV